MNFFEKISNFLGLYEEVEITEGEEIEPEKAKAKRLEETQRPTVVRRNSAEEAPPWLSKPKPAATAAGGSKVVSLPTANKQIKVMLVAPKIFDDAQIIADHVKIGKPVVVNFEETEEGVMKRIMDFIGGTVYALNGNIKMVGSKNMVCAPNNVDIDINKDFSTGKDFGPWRQ
ncbi:MAG: cell division protein SepF [Acidaminococcales bacterium]|nr:cell division protein SepF [Acidaminococcales bacterium]